MTKFTWLGHAAFQIEFDAGEILLLDPWIEQNPKYPKSHKIEKVDAIALSHGHFDHAGDMVSLAQKFQPKIVTMVETATWLEQKGAKNTVGMNKGGTVDLGFVKLTMTHALHSNSIKDGDQTLYGGEAAGFVLTLPDGRAAYFAGDTALFSDMQLLKHSHDKLELALLPIGDHYTMGPHDAAHAARLLGVKRVIPMHYGTFPVLTGTPEQLKQKVSKDGIEVWTLEPGKTVEWSPLTRSVGQ